jgi:hypothetical protein
MMPPDENGGAPTPGSADHQPINTISGHHTTDKEQSTCPLRVYPQEWLPDLGLSDDDCVVGAES